MNNITQNQLFSFQEKYLEFIWISVIHNQAAASSYYRPWPSSRRRRLGSLKEVIQPQVPLRLPCYDFTPVIDHTVVSALPRVKLPTSGATNFHGVTGGVYKTRERIHRDILIRDY